MKTLLCRFCEEDLTKRNSSYKNNYCDEECYKFYWQKRVRESKKKSYYKNREKNLEKKGQSKQGAYKGLLEKILCIVKKS